MAEHAADAWARARSSLAGRRDFRVARLGLLVLVSLAVYAPFLASERPLYLNAIHRGDFERARRTLVPVTEALAALMQQTSAEFEAARPPDSSQDLRGARAAERSSLAARLESLRRHLEAGPAARVDDFERELEAATASQGSTAPGEGLVERARALAAELDPARLSLRPARSLPLVAALAPVEVGLAAGWSLVLLLPLLARRLRPARALVSALLAAVLAGCAWRLAVGAGSAFHTASFKEQLTRGEIEAKRVLFAPIPFGFAEQHPQEALRPPTWLASSEMDERGAYVRGPRAPRPDAVTGFVPGTRPVEVRAGEPALNSPRRHPLGTDSTGRDLLARALHGARTSLAVGCLATAILVCIGVAVGAVAGYFGGALDLVLSRLIEVVVSVPLFFLVLVAVAFVGPSMWNVIGVLGCVGWTGVARLARSEFLRQRELEYVAAARALGFAWPRIVFRHVLPNTLAPLLVAATFSVAGAILVESALSFLGYGVRVPIASWGALTSESRELANWWLQLFPGLFLFATVLCVQLLGDALREALDPRALGTPARSEGAR
jgi:peptide/nickel transport system permease protein